MSTHRQRDSFNEINITPLTDIFLVLLIIMMVIAPLLDQQGLNLTVPTQHEAKKQEKQPKLITVNVSKDGQYTGNRGLSRLGRAAALLGAAGQRAAAGGAGVPRAVLHAAACAHTAF